MVLKKSGTPARRLSLRAKRSNLVCHARLDRASRELAEDYEITNRTKKNLDSHFRENDKKPDCRVAALLAMTTLLSVIPRPKMFHVEHLKAV